MKARKTVSSDDGHEGDDSAVPWTVVTSLKRKGHSSRDGEQRGAGLLGTPPCHSGPREPCHTPVQLHQCQQPGTRPASLSGRLRSRRGQQRICAVTCNRFVEETKSDIVDGRRIPSLIAFPLVVKDAGDAVEREDPVAASLERAERSPDRQGSTAWPLGHAVEGGEGPVVSGEGVADRGSGDAPRREEEHTRTRGDKTSDLGAENGNLEKDQWPELGFVGGAGRAGEPAAPPKSWANVAARATGTARRQTPVQPSASRAQSMAATGHVTELFRGHNNGQNQRSLRSPATLAIQQASPAGIGHHPPEELVEAVPPNHQRWSERCRGDDDVKEEAITDGYLHSFPEIQQPDWSGQGTRIPRPQRTSELGVQKTSQAAPPFGDARSREQSGLRSGEINTDQEGASTTCERSLLEDCAPEVTRTVQVESRKAQWQTISSRWLTRNNAGEAEAREEGALLKETVKASATGQTEQAALEPAGAVTRSDATAALAKLSGETSEASRTKTFVSAKQLPPHRSCTPGKREVTGSVGRASLQWGAQRDRGASGQIEDNFEGRRFDARKPSAGDAGDRSKSWRRPDGRGDRDTRGTASERSAERGPSSMPARRPLTATLSRVTDAVACSQEAALSAGPRQLHSPQGEGHVRVEPRARKPRRPKTAHLTYKAGVIYTGDGPDTKLTLSPSLAPPKPGGCFSPSLVAEDRTGLSTTQQSWEAPETATERRVCFSPSTLAPEKPTLSAEAVSKPPGIKSVWGPGSKAHLLQAIAAAAESAPSRAKVDQPRAPADASNQRQSLQGCCLTAYSGGTPSTPGIQHGQLELRASLASPDGHGGRIRRTSSPDPSSGSVSQPGKAVSSPTAPAIKNCFVSGFKQKETLEDGLLTQAGEGRPSPEVKPPDIEQERVETGGSSGTSACTGTGERTRGATRPTVAFSSLLSEDKESTPRSLGILKRRVAHADGGQELKPPSASLTTKPGADGLGTAQAVESRDCGTDAFPVDEQTRSRSVPSTQECGGTPAREESRGSDATGTTARGGKAVRGKAGGPVLRGSLKAGRCLIKTETPQRLNADAPGEFWPGEALAAEPASQLKTKATYRRGESPKRSPLRRLSASGRGEDAEEKKAEGRTETDGSLGQGREEGGPERNGRTRTIEGAATGQLREHSISSTAMEDRSEAQCAVEIMQEEGRTAARSLPNKTRTETGCVPVEEGKGNRREKEQEREGDGDPSDCLEARLFGSKRRQVEGETGSETGICRRVCCSCNPGAASAQEEQEDEVRAMDAMYAPVKIVDRG